MPAILMHVPPASAKHSLIAFSRVIMTSENRHWLLGSWMIVLWQLLILLLGPDTRRTVLAIRAAATWFGS